MSFGGGGGSTTGVNARKLNSATNEGGSLDNTSLLDDIPVNIRIVLGF